MVAVFVVGCGIAITLEVVAGGFGQDAVALYLAFTAFMVVGAVIVAHRPGNAIGWTFSAIGLLAAAGTLAMEYAAYAYVTRPGSLPAAIWPAWYQQQWWIPMLALVFVATPMLFPTGRLPSTRWRPVAAVAAVAAAALELLAALQPTIQLQDEDYWVDNPKRRSSSPPTRSWRPRSATWSGSTWSRPPTRSCCAWTRRPRSRRWSAPGQSGRSPRA
jgi:hypothetical protein